MKSKYCFQYLEILSLVLICSLNLMADSLSFLGSTGGKIRDIAIYDDVDAQKTYLYVAQGAAIIIFDVTDYQNPVEVNRFFAAISPIYNLSISEDLLAASCGLNGIRIFSLHNPIFPNFLNLIDEYTEKVILSGHLLYYEVYILTHWGSNPCHILSKTWNIGVIDNPELIDIHELCRRDCCYYSAFLFAADTKVSEPNIFWSYSIGPRIIIWNSSKGLNLPRPVPDIPDKMLTTQYPKIISYQDKVIITQSNKIIVYNPFILDGTQEILEIPIANVIVDPNYKFLIDFNELYLPTEMGYQVVDLTNIENPELLNIYPFPDFRIKYIRNGIAYGSDLQSVKLLNIKKSNTNVLVIPRTEYLSQLLQHEKPILPIRYYTIFNSIYSHPKSIYEIIDSTKMDSFNFILTRESSNSKLILIDDISIPEPFNTFEAYYVPKEAESIEIIENNILSLSAGDSGTFHFLLDDKLFGTPVDEWERY